MAQASLPQQRETRRDCATCRFDRAESGLRSGYRVYELGGDAYRIVRPDGGEYRVNCGRCSCPASVACKHLAMIAILLDARAARQEAARKCRADALLDRAYRMDALATAELEDTGRVWRLTATGLHARRQAVALYEQAHFVRFGGGRLEVEA